MAPSPQERNLPHQDVVTGPQSDGNRVVISGMSGLFPQSLNVKEFSDILYNKKNPITQTDLRFTYSHPEVVQNTGSVPGLNSFDAQFFKVHYRLANTMDPMARKVLEQSYQAIYDAGVNPVQLSGKKVGVYIGSCFSETEKACFYEAASRSGFGIAGCSKTMFANRISYWLNAKGPSMAIDEACCSSTAALEQAYLAMTRGECEAAIVGGAYLCLHPQSSVHYGRILKLCKDGKTKSFDKNADGCAKSEAINVLFLQKAKDALRIYAEVLHVKTEFICMLNGETGPKYGFYRSPSSTTNFIKKFYEDAKVPPNAIEYVEAFGCAVPEADKAELQAIEEVFCKNRKDPLMIGSVMSNIGYGEAASGISAITKVLLGYHNGELAANLHCEQPLQEIEALRDGRMRVVTEHHRFGRSYAAVNGMSVTGVNSHVLLHGHYIPKDINRYKTNIPYLVNVSGRHEDAVKELLEILKSNPIDPEQLALLHNIHRTSVPGHMGRGYIVLQTNEEQKTVSLSEKAEYFDDERRPLWFVYSGMGSQWAGMGAQLMRIPIFAAAIERCRKVLEPKGLDIVNIITSEDETIFNNILHSFVGIAAVQIGLTDILREIGLKPDGIIGHSVGELGCAYADGCLTAEEMILSAYYRGLVSLETEFIHGSMAAVGMGYEEISKICPPEIEVACHNGPDSSTISGPADVMKAFVAELTAKQIFAKEVPCSNIAYHSRYIANAGPGLLKYLKEAISDPKLRSERWLSSSVPQARWEEPLAKICSPEYLTNNLLSPVLFEETSRLVPNNAVLVEIAPHGLLQAILKRSMPSNCKNIPLTRRKHPDNAFLLLDAIGKLFMEGFNSNLQLLYPKVQMPVSTGTPFLSHFVRWAHGEPWPLPLYRSANRKIASNCYFVISTHDQEHSYLKGHSVRGNIVFPFAASLTLAWDTLAMLMGVPKKQLSVQFSNVHLYAQPILHDRRQLKLSVAIHRGTGYFEILDGSSKVATGYINTLAPNQGKYNIEEGHEEKFYTDEDVYQLLRDRDYMYSGEFRSIERVDESMSKARLLWRDNWVTFIDGMLQLNVLRQQHDAVSLPKHIRNMCIDVEEHNQLITNTPNTKILMKAEVCEEFEDTRCGGVLIETIRFENVPPLSGNKLALKSLKFISNLQTGIKVSSSLEAYCQIVAENVGKTAISVVGIVSDMKEASIFNGIHHILNNIFGIKVSYKQITREEMLKNFNFKTIDLILVHNLCFDKEILERLQKVLHYDQFVVNEKIMVHAINTQPSSFYRVLCDHTCNQDGNNCQTHLQLVRWGAAKARSATTTISVRNKSDFEFLNSVHSNLATDHQLLVVSQYPAASNVKELIRSWRKGNVRNKVSLVEVSNDSVDNLEQKLSEIKLAFNVVQNGNLGGEYFLPVEESARVCERVTLRSERFSDYDSLHWVEAPELPRSELNVTVHYAGINNNDIRKANGTSFEQDFDNSYGADFSGITDRGDRVMGIVRSGAASTQLQAQSELLWPVPAHWSLEDAATVPLAYLQAFYCFGVKTKLYRGMSVLIHGGAGALGQAAITVALAHGCKVFTTVSDIRKKTFLRKLFPKLKADHIGSSRDVTFGDMIQILTKTKGCDIIISCVKGQLKNVTIKCTSFTGMCCDISQLQNKDDYNFGMHSLTRERNYSSVDFSKLFDPENIEEIKLLHKMMSEGIARGYVRPLSRVTYSPQEATRAFRFLAESRHRGRVLLHMKGKNSEVLQISHRLMCNAERCHLILCNESTFGLQFADRLVTRGVKKLFLHVQKQSQYLHHKIRTWQKLGVKVVVSSDNLDGQKGVLALFNKAMALGTIEGVYITSNGADIVFQERLINDLDTLTRKLCPDLRYFGVLHADDDSIGQSVCLHRSRDELPATMLMLPESEASFTHCRGTLDAVEKALQTTHNGILLAHLEKRQRVPLLKQIATLAGISIKEDVDKSLTLQELGVEVTKVHLIGLFLRVQYNFALNEKQITSLTINDIQELENAVIELPFEETRGLQTFFSYVDPDELLATAEMVALPTLVNSASMRDDEFESSQSYLCIVPGIEGHHERFRVMCERLKLPALVLQPGLDHPHETVRETAQKFTEVLLKKTELKDTFYLLGYETGVFVALEIAAILEENGLTGTVFCVGCAPDEFHKELNEQLSEFASEEQLQDGVLRHMYTLMAGSDTALLEKALENTTSWSQKIDACVRTLLGRVSHSAQYARALIETAVARITQVRQYSAVARPLRSRLVLLRAATAHVTQQHSVLQSLQRYSQQPVSVHQLKAPLSHVAADLNCAAIINENLDSTILEDFSAKNICDTYLLNANSFMSIEVDK
ncbi:fatty acid synthase-like [Anticarsia gemmatalis]|uniref:fatty acid synthase-like n=1 Tax=Anticarsia gemmatalis TaxID=129554 RepID=UPI003F76AEB6